MTKYAKQLLIECLVNQADDDTKADEESMRCYRAMAERAVESLMGAQIAAGIIETRHLEAWEHEAHVYHLSEAVTPSVIALRLGHKREVVSRMLSRHLRRRRAALAA